MQADRLHIIGHENRRSSLRRLHSKNNIPPAFILAGHAGVGKKLVAFELYRSFYCVAQTKKYGGCGQCKNCQLFLDQTLPYYRFIDCSLKEQGSVEAMRELLHSLHFKAAENEKRVVILDNAENLSVPAQNILLKTLEEPRADTYFALITASPSRLLPTVQSRCQLWFFDTLNETQILELIKHYQLEAKLDAIDAAVLALLADGSMQNISTLLDYQSEWPASKELIKHISKAEFNAVFTSLQGMKTDKDLLKVRLSILRIMTRQAMLKSSDLHKNYAWSIFLSNIIIAEQLIFERNLSAELVLQNLSLSLQNSSRFQSFTGFTHDARLLSSVVA